MIASAIELNQAADSRIPIELTLEARTTRSIPRCSAALSALNDMATLPLWISYVLLAISKMRTYMVCRWPCPIPLYILDLVHRSCKVNKRITPLDSLLVRFKVGGIDLFVTVPLSRLHKIFTSRIEADDRVALCEGFTHYGTAHAAICTGYGYLQRLGGHLRTANQNGSPLEDQMSRKYAPTERASTSASTLPPTIAVQLHDGSHLLHAKPSTPTSHRLTYPVLRPLAFSTPCMCPQTSPLGQHTLTDQNLNLFSPIGLPG